MPRFNVYLLIELLSAAMILVMGVCMFAVSVPRVSELRNYRISRVFLAAAYMLLSAVGLWVVFGDKESGGQSEIMAFTVIAASYQALLFTFSLITLINPRYMTARGVWSQAVPITVLSTALLLFLFLGSERAFLIAFYTALGIYCCQLVSYVVIFTREYKKYHFKMDNFFSSNEERRMLWIKRSFYMATCVGVLATASLFANILIYTIFTGAYTIFYIYFALKYINYVNQFHRIAPVVLVRPAETGSNGGSSENLPALLAKWVEKKDFLLPGINLESLASELQTNHSYLSRHINSEYGQNFRSWINSLRIGESMRLIEAGKLSMDEIAEMIGLPSRSTFYRQFSSVVGMSPTEYRNKRSK